jgi:hypothetical protein
MLRCSRPCAACAARTMLLPVAGSPNRLSRLDCCCGGEAEKHRRADFIVDSSQSFDHARAQVRDNARSARIMPLAVVIQRAQHPVRSGDRAA